MFDAILKYVINEIASTIVVIKGLAITAGSSFIFFASKGNIQPIISAKITVQTSVKDTTKETIISILSNNINFIKLTIAKVIPHFFQYIKIYYKIVCKLLKFCNKKE